MKTTVLFLLISSQSFAEVLKQNSKGDFTVIKNSFKTSELLQDYAKVRGLNLTVISDLKDVHFEIHGKKIIPRDKLDHYVSTLLYHNDSAIIKNRESKSVQVIHARDLKFHTVPVYHQLEDVPENEYQAQFSHQLKYIESSELARNMRPFLGREGRVIDDKSSNTIYLVDTGKNIRRIMQIATGLDTPDYKKTGGR